MNQNFSDITTQTAGDIGSHNSVTYFEHHIHQTTGEGQDGSIDVLLRRINSVIARPQICHLDDTLRRSARQTALAIPDLPVIESIISQSPPWQTIRRYNDRGDNWEATTAEILQVRSMAQSLLEHNVDEGIWKTLARLFGSLGSKFADIGWSAGALRMGYHEVQIRCALANLKPQTISPDLSRFSVNPADYPHHVEFLSAVANLLQYRSLYSANVFCFNDARKASKQAIRIQCCLCKHDSANAEFKSALSWMQKHLSSFRHQDAAYKVVVSRSIGNMMPFPADVTKFDIARGALRQVIEVVSGMIALVSLLAAGPKAAILIYATGWGIGESLSFINRRS